MTKRILTIFSAAFAAALWGDNMLTNSSFEETIPLKEHRWKIDLVKDWELNLNSGKAKCRISLAEPGLSGQKALRLQTIGKEGFSSASFGKMFDVKPGQKVTATVKMRGKGHGYIRIYFNDAQGKYLKKYQMMGRAATDKWEEILLKFAVPEGVEKIAYSLQTLRNDADVLFDDAQLFIEQGEILENANVRVELDPRLGGGIASFVWKPKNFEATRPNRMGVPCGMMNAVIPDRRLPGEVFYQTYDRLSLSQDAAVYRTRLGSGKFKGLEITRSYKLLPCGVELALEMSNKGTSPLAVTQRMQNSVNSAPGVYSWPTPDWVTVFRQTGEPLNGLNSFFYDLFRAGWEAKYYPQLEASLVFKFDVLAVRRLYCYMVREPGLSTVEWYLKEYKLAPGETKKFVFSAEFVPGKCDYYADARGKKQRAETIKPVKMPPVPAEPQGAEKIREFFCFSASLGNLHQPELAGFHVNRGYTKQNIILQKRLSRILIDSYFNALYPSRFFFPGTLQEAARETGKNFLGELARKHQVKIVPGYLFSRRSDVDPEKYMKEQWPEKKAMLENKDVQAFFNEYKDVIPLLWTGDELLAQNADVLLRIHQELRSIMPEGISFFPYLNSSSIDLLPYMPVYLGDWYPIKRRSSSGRNPWSVYPEFSRIVKIAGDKPVWFMPQGFAGSADNNDGIYAFPSSGEIRLMLNLAVAAGVRGIAWHGFSSGTWPWMMCYHMYRYSMLGAGGQKSPSWPGVVDCAKQLTTVSPLLLKAAPCALPAGAGLKTGSFKSANGFYDGDAVKLFALKVSPSGYLLIAINQNPQGREKGEVTLPAGENWDLTALAPVEKRTVELDLAPGSAVYFGCGLSAKQVDEVFLSRFRAERARYLLLAEKAQGAKIPAVDPDALLKNPPRKALALLLEEREKLQTRIDASPLGRLMKKMESLQSKLDAMDFRLCCARELVVTPEMWKATRRYARWTAHPDKNYESLRQRLAAVFARYYVIFDKVWSGRETGDSEKELDAIAKEADEVLAGLTAWLDARASEIDDPYKE